MWKEYVSYFSASPLILPLFGTNTEVVSFAAVGSYVENVITEEEFTALPPQLQDRVKRTAVTRETQSRVAAWNVDIPLNRCRRVGKFNLYSNSSRREDIHAKKLD